MKFAFVRCKDPFGTTRFVRVSAFDQKFHEDPGFFDSCEKDVVVFENIYIAAFRLIETISDIEFYNPESKLILEFTLKDIFFMNHTVSDYCEIMRYKYE